MTNRSKVNAFGSSNEISYVYIHYVSCSFQVKLHYPVERAGHCAVVIEDTLYLWGGEQKKLPNVHDNEAKRAVTTVIDVFHLYIQVNGT